jgi:RimJ/RimL family protein N-acetyltransferase
VPEARGKGHGSAAQQLLAEYLFASTVYRLEAGTDLENVADQRALQKAGFEREGVARQSQYRDGGYHDMVMFSRLRSRE